MRSLTERLRALAHRIDTLGGNTYVMPEEREDLREAADQIEADAERIAELEALVPARCAICLHSERSIAAMRQCADELSALLTAEGPATEEQDPSDGEIRRRNGSANGSLKRNRSGQHD